MIHHFIIYNFEYRRKFATGWHFAKMKLSTLSYIYMILVHFFTETSACAALSGIGSLSWTENNNFYSTMHVIHDIIKRSLYVFVYDRLLGKIWGYFAHAPWFSKKNIKKRLDSDDEQFYQYQQNEELTLISNHKAKRGICRLKSRAWFGTDINMWQG